jgi:type VI secretion system secreted protein Hcp
MFTKRVVAGAMSLAVLLSAASSGAALQAYLKLKGQKQGDIKPDKAPATAPQAAAPENIPIVDFDMAVVSPRDPQSGLPTGQRMHKPLVIRKEVDTTSPKLFQAMSTTEAFTSFVLVQPEPGVAGGTITATLTNAHITGITPIVPDAAHPELTKGRRFESIAVTFDRMDVQHSPSGKTESYAY